MLSAEAWKMSSQNDSLLYRLQVNGTTGKSSDKLAKAVEGWRESGTIFHKDGQVELLFSCSFADEQKWIEWAKNFPYELVEISPNTGKPKPIKLGVASKTRKKRRAKTKTSKTKTSSVRKKRGKATCSNCGGKGHNSRSCTNPTKQKPKKKLAKRQNTCKVCGVKGHNSRSCIIAKTL
jgi:ubiquitin